MDLKIECSPNLGAWLQQEKISLAFTTYQTNRLILLGSYEDGRITLQERLFDKPMGLYADATSLYMSTRYQIWTLENRLAPGEAFQDGDCLYVPSSAYTTGNVNVHDVALDRKGKLIFVNTDFSCLAELKTGYSFQPIWQPPFISELRAEDRCHLNGLALVEGEPTYLSACSETNEGAGWRNCRQDGGIVLHLPSNEIIMRGLSMPHSPRFYRDKLWVLNSGSGELGYIEAEKFYPITFCSAFVRGLAFWKNYAFVGLSKLRSAVFSGLVLEERLLAKGHKALCGLMVVDLNTGEIVHSLIFNETIEELFDVVVLPGVIRPKLLGLQNEDIERLVCFPGSQGLMVTRPTVKRPSLGPKAPIAGLPEATISSSEPTTILTQAEEEAWNRPPQPLNTAINFQRVYHLNPESLAPYDGIMFPSLQVRWKNQSPKGEIVGVSAALEGDLLGFVIGERLPDGTAEIISLFVEPSYRHQGIATRLVSVLEKDCWDTGVVALRVLYTPSRWTSAALEPLLKRRGWKIDAWGNQMLATKGHPDLLEQVSPEKADPSLKVQVKTLFDKAKQRVAAQDYSAAIACYQAALQILPNYPPTYCNLGSLWQLEGNLPEAIEAFQKAIQLQQNLLVAYQNLGGLYSNEHRYQEAIKLLQQGLTYLPCASLHLALGDIYRQLGDIAAAMEYYREAIRLDENYIAAYQNLGGLLMSINNIAGAKFCFKKALDLNTEIPGIYRNLGEIYEAEGNPIKALECLNYALTLEPDNLDVLYRREHLQVALCDWDDYDQRMLTLLVRLENYLQTQENAALPPLSLNSFPASLPLHRDFNRHWAKNIQARMAESKRRLGFIFPRETPSKLRIGYLSADFRNHAVGLLIRELFACHNRDQFEVYAYSLSNRTDEITEQISSGCDHYQMIASLSVEAAAEQIHSDGIHILIDLCGYTNLCRPEILALQPAPLQLHYLGYPDTLGADFIPYILGDRFLIPPHLAKYYTETLVELPHAFVTTSLSFSEPPPPRSELGLPDGEFVYACFNRTDKWSPELFACWIEILQAVPNAVLWLAESSEVVSQTLQAKAKTAGVNPARLVFLVKRSPREFISVCRQANLFLDTFLYNGGATSVCAIQAGVPLLTCPGDTFASRMGMSICHAAGLESFVCESLESYQVQAIYWGTHSEELRQFTQQWQQQQGDLPLFQTATWIKAMETQLMNLWQNQIRNCI